MNKKIYAISKWLVVFSVLSIFGGLMSIVLPSQEYATSNEGLYYGLLKVWRCYLFLPIPIISMIYGIYYNKKRVKVKKNIIVGIVFSILLISYGSMGFIGLKNYSTNIKYLEEVEDKTTLDFPSGVRILTFDWTTGKLSSSDDNFIKYESVVRFMDVNESYLFTLTLVNDDRWITSLLPSIELFIPKTFYLESKDYDYFMIYCIENNSFNVISRDENYNYIYFAYNVDDRVLLIKEFSKK